MSTTAVATAEQLDDASLLSLVTSGDCKRLNPQQKIAYYKARCEAAGLDPRTAPFQFLTLQGKEILYALKAATDQLAAKHGIRCEILDQRTEDGIRVVTVRAITKDGRQTDEIGAVAVKGLQGDALCNALMKAATKAKRRATLGVCGLGMLDETELETIPGATLAAAPTIKMPTRLSVRSSDEAPRVRLSAEVVRAGGVTDDARANDRESLPLEPELDLTQPEPIPGDDLEPLLQASLDQARDMNPITEPQRRRLFALMREHGHSKEGVSAFLRRRGINSSKDITVSQYDFVEARLSDPTPMDC